MSFPGLLDLIIITVKTMDKVSFMANLIYSKYMKFIITDQPIPKNPGAKLAPNQPVIWTFLFMYLIFLSSPQYSYEVII
jgi:hypothetical protein